MAGFFDGLSDQIARNKQQDLADAANKRADALSAAQIQDYNDAHQVHDWAAKDRDKAEQSHLRLKAAGNQYDGDEGDLASSAETGPTPPITSAPSVKTALPSTDNSPSDVGLGSSAIGNAPPATGGAPASTVAPSASSSSPDMGLGSSDAGTAPRSALPVAADTPTSSSPTELRTIPVQKKDGTIGYAAPSKVTKLTGVEGIRAQGEMLRSEGDPVLAMQILKGANDLSSSDIDTKAKEYGNSMMPLIARLKAGDTSVIGQIDALGARVPGNITQPQTTLNKDGSLDVTHMVNTQHGPMVGATTHFDNVDQYAAGALSLASPAAMTANLSQQSELATQAMARVNSQHAEQRAQEMQPYEIAYKKALAWQAMHPNAGKKKSDADDWEQKIIPSADGGQPTVLRSKGGDTQIAVPDLGFVDINQARPETITAKRKLADENGWQLQVHDGQLGFSNPTQPGKRSDGVPWSQVGGAWSPDPSKLQSNKKEPMKDNGALGRIIKKVGSVAATVATTNNRGLAAAGKVMAY